MWREVTVVVAGSGAGTGGRGEVLWMGWREDWKWESDVWVLREGALSRARLVQQEVEQEVADAVVAGRMTMEEGLAAAERRRGWEDWEGEVVEEMRLRLVFRRRMAGFWRQREADEVSRRRRRRVGGGVGPSRSVEVVAEAEAEALAVVVEECMRRFAWVMHMRQVGYGRQAWQDWYREWQSGEAARRYRWAARERGLARGLGVGNPDSP